MGFLRPKVVRGYFTVEERGNLQKMLFDELLRLGFRRTYWQLVFPGQTAGIVKKIPSADGNANEYHVRFYEDGVIDCEFEFHRFSTLHWNGERSQDPALLEHFLPHTTLTEEVIIQIRGMFGTKPYAENCLRSWKLQKQNTN